MCVKLQYRKTEGECKIWYYVKLLAICHDNFGSYIIDEIRMWEYTCDISYKRKIYNFYLRIYDRIKFFVKLHKKHQIPNEKSTYSYTHFV